MANSMSSSGTIFTHQSLLTSLSFHMYVWEAMEKWLEEGDTGKVSRNLSNGSLFGA